MSAADWSRFCHCHPNQPVPDEVQPVLQRLHVQPLDMVTGRRPAQHHHPDMVTHSTATLHIQSRTQHNNTDQGGAHPLHTPFNVCAAHIAALQEGMRLCM